MVDETEIAWAAGFFDGEGSTNYVRCSTIRLSLAQCGSEDDPPHSLVRFHRAVGGAGNVRKERGAVGNWSPAWRWICTRGARDTIALLWPYLSEAKLKQASDAILKAGAYTRKPMPKRERCRRGHLFAETRVTTPNGSIHCTECRKITSKAAYRREAANRARSSSV